MSLKYVVRFSPDRAPYRGRFLYLGEEGKVVDSLRGARRFDSIEEAREQLALYIQNLEGGTNILGLASVVVDYKTFSGE